MRNAHLPARLGWVAYRFKLWAGIRYRIATLSVFIAVAKRLLRVENFQSLNFLGINQNIKMEWTTIHRAFRSVGLFSFAVEQSIGMINTFIQHYGAGTTLAKKLSAYLEALQLEIGCIGNPLKENFYQLQSLATPCWTKSFWERLHYYRFKIYLRLYDTESPKKI